MAGLHANFIECTTGTEGTGNITLVRKTGYPLPLDVYSANDTFEYTIKNGNNWETGLGTVNAANVLVRTTPYATWIDATTTYDDTSPSPLDLSGTSSVGVVNTGQNIDAPTVDSLTVNDDGDVTLGGTGQVLLPQVNDAVNPTISFGSAGLYQSTNNQIDLSFIGVLRWVFNQSQLRSATTGGGSLGRVAATNTVPVHIFSGDSDTGIGRAAEDQLSHIAGGIEYLRGTEVSSIVTIDFFGNTVYPKAAGSGIKVDNAAPTFGWADLLGDQFSKNTGASKPVLAVYNGAVQAWQFSNGDEAYLTYHIPHDYVPGTDIHLHIHWSQTSATVTGGTLDFKYFAIYSKGHNQASGSAFTSTPITATFSSIDINDGGAGLTRYQQHFTEVIISGASATSALFDRDDFEPDGVIELTFEMDANNLTDSVTVLDPFVHFVDIHYQTTSIIGTKDKAPDFYA